MVLASAPDAAAVWVPVIVAVIAAVGGLAVAVVSNRHRSGFNELLTALRESEREKADLRKQLADVERGSAELRAANQVLRARLRKDADE